MYLFFVVSFAIFSAVYTFMHQQDESKCTSEPVGSSSCYYKNIHNDIPSIESRKLNFPNNSTFFIEPYCIGSLSYRQACSVETVARANPDRSIYILFLGPIDTECLTSEGAWEILKYHNIQIYRVQLETLLKETEFEDMLTDIDQYPVAFVADLIKYLILYKYGGTYIDLRVLETKPLDFLPQKTNWAGKVDMDTVGAQIMSLSTYGIGRDISTAILRNMLDDFKLKTQNWWLNGNGLLTRVLKQICVYPEVSRMSVANCGGFAVYEPFYFYPVHFKTWRNYFSTVSDVSSDPFAFYIWKDLPPRETLFESSLYARLTNNYCPRINNIVY